MLLLALADRRSAKNVHGVSTKPASVGRLFFLAYHCLRCSSLSLVLKRYVEHPDTLV